MGANEDLIVEQWLGAHGLRKYYELLKKSEIESMEAVLMLTEDELRNMGMHKVGARRKLLYAIQAELDARANNAGREPTTNTDVVGRAWYTTPSAVVGEPLSQTAKGHDEKEAAAVVSKNVGKTIEQHPDEERRQNVNWTMAPSSNAVPEERRENPGWKTSFNGGPVIARPDSEDEEERSPGPSNAGTPSSFGFKPGQMSPLSHDFSQSLGVSCIDLADNTETGTDETNRRPSDLVVKVNSIVPLNHSLKDSEAPEIEVPSLKVAADVPPANVPSYLANGVLSNGSGNLPPLVENLSFNRDMLAAENRGGPLSLRSNASFASSLGKEHIDHAGELVDSWETMGKGPQSPILSPMATARPPSPKDLSTPAPTGPAATTATVPPLERMKRAVARHRKVMAAQKGLIEITGKGAGSLRSVNKEGNQLLNEKHQDQLDFFNVVKKFMAQSPLARPDNLCGKQKSGLFGATPLTYAPDGESPARRGSYASSMGMIGAKNLPPLAPPASMAPIPRPKGVALTPHKRLLTGKNFYATMLQTQELEQARASEEDKKYRLMMENFINTEETAWAKLAVIVGMQDSALPRENALASRNRDTPSSRSLSAIPRDHTV